MGGGRVRALRHTRLPGVCVHQSHVALRRAGPRGARRSRESLRDVSRRGHGVDLARHHERRLRDRAVPRASAEHQARGARRLHRLPHRASRPHVPDRRWRADVLELPRAGLPGTPHAAPGERRRGAQGAPRGATAPDRDRSQVLAPCPREGDPWRRRVRLLHRLSRGHRGRPHVQPSRTCRVHRVPSQGGERGQHGRASQSGARLPRVPHPTERGDRRGSGAWVRLRHLLAPQARRRRLQALPCTDLGRGSLPSRW